MCIFYHFVRKFNAVLKLITFVRYYQNEIKVPGYMLHCFLPSSRNKHRKAPQVIDESQKEPAS